VTPAPLAIPKRTFERISSLCLALPEVTVRVDESRVSTRSTAYAFDVRWRPFCLLIAVADASGEQVPQVVLRVDPNDREALLSIGHPFYDSRGGRDRIRVLLTDGTDWEEIGGLVAESYRMLAPKKLIAVLD
jgi:hypothetical protein